MQNGSGPSSSDPYQQTANRIQQYALVAYIHGRLGDFLYQLRQEIVPDCRLRSHVSVLPPRPLSGTEESAQVLLAETSRRQPAFEVRLGEVEIFPVTNVIYIGLADGAAQLHQMHDLMNAGPLTYQEPFAYHPHITLAQEIAPDIHAAAHELCLRRWQEYDGPRSFPVETITFVHNTGTACGWQDLSETRLEMAGTRL